MNGDIGRSEPEPPSLPRKVTLARGTEGYGFNLHGEKGIHGQFISAVDEGSPAQLQDVRVGDRVIAVNEEDVEDFAHSKVVDKIRAGGSEVTLLLVDDQCDEYYKTLGVKIPQDKFVAVIAKEAVVAAEIVEEPVANVREEEPVANVREEEDEPEVQQNGEVVEAEPPAPVLEERTEVERRESVEKEEDAYEEVIPLSSNNESVEKPAETTPDFVAVEEQAVDEQAVDEQANIVVEKTTTEVEAPNVQETSPSNDLDMAAARPKPKRNEVKRATQNWKQKYEDFNKL